MICKVHVREVSVVRGSRDATTGRGSSCGRQSVGWVSVGCNNGLEIVMRCGRQYGPLGRHRSKYLAQVLPPRPNYNKIIHIRPRRLWFLEFVVENLSENAVLLICGYCYFSYKSAHSTSKTLLIIYDELSY